MIGLLLDRRDRIIKVLERGGFGQNLLFSSGSQTQLTITFQA